MIASWDSIFGWFDFFHRQNFRFPSPAGEEVSNLALEILIRCCITETNAHTNRIYHVAQSTPRLLPMLLEIWCAEAQEHQVTTTHNAAYTLFVYIKEFSGPMIHDTVVTTHGGGESSIARTALNHFRHEMAQPSPNFEGLCVDLSIINLLGSYLPLRDAILPRTLPYPIPTG